MNINEMTKNTTNKLKSFCKNCLLSFKYKPVRAIFITILLMWLGVGIGYLFPLFAKIVGIIIMGTIAMLIFIFLVSSLYVVAQLYIDGEA